MDNQTDHHPENPKQYRIGGVRLVVGIFVILIGLVFMAEQFGLSRIDVNDLWKLWPLFIILVGISVFSKGRRLTAIQGLALGVILLGGAVAILWYGHTDTTPQSQNISIGAEGQARSAQIDLILGAAKIVLTGGSTGLINGTYTSDAISLNTASSVANGLQTVKLEMDAKGRLAWWGNRKNELIGQLSDNTPVVLNLKSGASDLDLNLQTVKASEVKIDAGAASLDLTLGARIPEALVTINAGASSITINVPSASGVDLDIEAAFAGKDLSGFDKLSDNHYVTSGFDGATNKIRMKIRAGASSIAVHRI